MHVVILPMANFEVPREPLASVFQLHQAQVLHEAGFKVGVINPGLITTRFLFRRYPYRERESVGGIPVYRKYVRLVIPARLRDPWHFNDLLASIGIDLLDEYIASHGDPDLLHAHNAIPAGAIAKRMAELKRIPYVVTEHNSTLLTRELPEDVVRQYARTYASASTVLAVSQALKQVLMEDIRLPVGQVRVLANVLDPLFLEPPPATPRTRTGFTFLHVGSLTDIKDQELLIRAFGICGFEPDVVLRIGGAGPLRTRLAELVDVLGLRDQVLFLGALTRQQVREEMSTADAFVLSSRAETFGVVLVEALACGTPVISTDCGGPRDIVSEGLGILTPVGDVSAFAGALRSVHDDVAQFDRGVVRRVCLERYGPDRFVSELRAVYERAVDSARSDAAGV